MMHNNLLCAWRKLQWQTEKEGLETAIIREFKAVLRMTSLIISVNTKGKIALLDINIDGMSDELMD